MKKTLLCALMLLVLLVLLVLVIPSATPLALGEEAPYPTYVPVTLQATEIAPIPYEGTVPYAPNPDNYLPDRTGYLDPTISVRVEEMRVYDTDVQLTWVQIADASQLRAKLANPYPSKKEVRPDVIAKRVSAVLAINDDWFMHRKEGYIVRNGEELRTNYSAKYDSLIIDDKGDLHIIQMPSEEKIKSFEGTIIQALAFGPGLVVDGELVELNTSREYAPDKPTQRIAFCQMDSLSYLIVATAGGKETPGSTGLTISQMQQLCYDLGVRQAYNLDGGNSSSVILNGKKINSMGMRSVRSIGGVLYFITADPAVPKED